MPYNYPIKSGLLLILFLLFIGCEYRSHRNTYVRHQSVDSLSVKRVELYENDKEAFSNLVLEWDTFKITEYYELFGLNEDFDSFKDLNYVEAHENKTFVLKVLNAQNAFLSFETTHTPPQWDGDAEEETLYEITYWNLSDNSRLIALCSTTITWVSEQSDSLLFYVHDQDGINKIMLDAISWDMGSFIGHQYKSLFDINIWTDPPVSIALPDEMKEIEVRLAFDEYMDDQNAYRVMDSLRIESKILKFDPTKYYNNHK